MGLGGEKSVTFSRLAVYNEASHSTGVPYERREIYIPRYLSACGSSIFCAHTVRPCFSRKTLFHVSFWMAAHDGTQVSLRITLLMSVQRGSIVYASMFCIIHSLTRKCSVAFRPSFFISITPFALPQTPSINVHREGQKQPG